MERPTIFEAAGGEAAFLRLASAHHRRCLEDPVLNHPFSHARHPQHVERLAGYWAEVFGGPAVYTETGADQSAMLEIHSRTRADSDLGERFLACFLDALDDAAIPEDDELRGAMRSYMQWAVVEVMRYSPADAVVPGALPVPRWSWSGLQDPDAGRA